MESQAQLSQQHRPSLQTSRFTSGVVPGHQPTCLPNSNCMESTTAEGATSGRGPIATGGDQQHWRLKKKKRQRQKHAHHWQQFTRVQFHSRQNFGCQPIKLQLYPLVHTHPANYVRVHFKHLGVYKGSRVAYRAITDRVS